MDLSGRPARAGERSPWPWPWSWSWSWPRYGGRLRGQLADPLLRNGYALMVNTGATGLLGLLYWLLAARLYDPAEAGRASAAYATMNLLAGLAGLSFAGALTRFLPQAGCGTRRLVARSYTISIAASAVMTTGFLLAVGRLGDSYSELRSAGAGAVFLICVAAWVLFTLQDSVLTGLRGASWVLAENGAFGVVKIMLLVAFAVVAPQLGIYVSWMLPVLVAVPLVNALIFGRLVPRHAILTAGRTPPTSRQIGRFLAGDCTGALAVLATTNLVPVLVASRLSPRATAYFFMAWAVGGVLQLLSVNMAASLTVEGAFDASTISANCRAALRRMTVIMVPCALAAALFARWGLGLFGAGYAAQGTPVLIFLALGTLPQALIELYLGVLRAQSRAGRVALLQGIRCAAILLLTLVLTIRVGTAGAGVAFLVSQAAVATLTAPGWWLALTGRAGRAASRAEVDVGLDLIPGLRVPAQTGPAHARPAQARPAQAGPAQTGPAHAGPVQAGPARAGPARAGPARAGPARADLARVGPACTTRHPPGSPWPHRRGSAPLTR